MRPILTTLIAVIALSAASLTFMGCGGDDSSGIDRNRTLSSLDGAEVQELCEFTIDAAGGAGAEFTCPDDVTVTVDTVAECVSDIGTFGSCTVGVVEDCAVADPCDFAACVPLLSCGG